MTGLLFKILYLPLQLTAPTLVYFDLRARTEGLDLALAAARDSGGEAQAADIFEQSPQASRRGLVTANDMGVFVLLPLALCGACAAFYGVLIALLAVLSAAGTF